MRNCLFVFIFLLLSAAGYGQCTLNISISPSNTSICSGNKVLLTANVTGGSGALTYVWNTGQSTQSIDVNKEGTYTVTVTDQTPGCPGKSANITINTGVTPDQPVVTGKSLVCPGTSATFHATGPPGSTFQWYDAPQGGNFLYTGDTYVTAPINSGIIFYVQATVSGCPSLRTGVYCDVTGNPKAEDVQTCFGTNTVLTATGGDNYQWFDAQNGGTMVGTGPNFTTPVLFNTTIYYVQATVGGCLSSRTPVRAIVTPAPQVPVAPNVTICAGSTASLHATPGPGIFAWYDQPAGGTALILSPDYTTPPLTDNKSYYVENVRNGCKSTRTRVDVTVNQVPIAPGDQVQTTCKGSSILLTASATPPASGTYEWYTTAAGTTPVATGLTYQTPVLNINTTYYVLLNNGGCTSQRSKINVIVNPPPAPPSVSTVIICNGSTATLTATGPGGTYSWYNVQNGGTALFTGDTFTTPPLTGNTRYYVETNISGCISPRKLVTVTVNPPVSPPSAADVSTCSGSSATLVASGGSNYAWYDSNTGGTLLATTRAFTTPPLTGPTTYYVETTVNGCVSARKAVKVSINPVPADPTVTGNLSVCYGSTTTLTANGPGGTFQWYDALSGGNLVKATAAFTTPAITANVTYYVQNTLGTCVSNRTAVNITVVSPVEPQFQYPSGSVCKFDPTNPVPAINNPSGGTFSAAPAGLTINPTTGEITLATSNPGVYTITFTGNGACAPPSKASFKIYSTANASFSYNPVYCQDATNPKPNFGGVGSGGAFTASPAGLVFVNSSTGEINLKKSTPGNYTITNTVTGAGGCGSDTKTASVIIDQAVTISAGPDQTVAAGAQVQLAGSVSGVPKGTWTGGTGTFSNNAIPNPVYTPGPGETSATLTYTSDDPTGSCLPKSDKMVILFKNTLPKPVVTGNSTCSGSAANLSAISPGGTYKWYDAASGGTLLHTGANFMTPILTTNTTYYVETVNAAGVSSPRTQVDVAVNSVPVAPVVPVNPLCAGNSIKLIPNDQTGTFEWYDAATGGNLLAKTPTYTTQALTTSQTYYVQQTINGCTSPRAQVDVTVSPLPNVTSTSAGSVCSGNALNYTITANIAAATFSWGRSAVAGISNPAVSNQTTNPITETLINTSRNAVDVKYIITPINNGCPGPAFIYTVTVYPTPAVTSSAKPPPVCNKAPVNYTITFNTVADFDWSRAAVPGISNTAISGQNTATIRETLINTTNNPIDVVYVVNSRTATCTGAPFNVTVTVNPSVRLTSSETGTACSNVPQNYVITSNIPTATFIWSRDPAGGIQNPAVSGQTSSTITETLINTLPVATHVVYKIQAMANGCPADSAFSYVVMVNPQPLKPVANSNSPICVGSTIQLRTPDVANATFLWTGPNGYSSTQQNPDITNATPVNVGDYKLVVTVDGCSSEVSTASVMVRTPGIADAGPDQIVCITDPEIILDGKVTGGTGQGIWTSTSANPGKFSSLTDLKAHYAPSQDERNVAVVTFVLTTTSDDGCAISTDTAAVHFGPLPAVNAGPDQSLCAQTPVVQLHGFPLLAGTKGNWTTAGTGNFSSLTDYNAQYFPSTADAASGSVNLILHVTKNGPCEIETDTVKINFIPPPTVNAEKIRYVLKDRTITLHPNVSSDSVTYLWTPNINIEDPTVKNPVITGVDDIVYRLTVTDSRGCVSSDTTIVKVAPKLVVPNTFTPNNDGVNDIWTITGLIAYTDAVVDIYTRYGQKVYHSIGYDKPFDGIFNGKQLPTGVYYYVIDTKLFNQVLSGSLTLLR